MNKKIIIVIILFVILLSTTGGVIYAKIISDRNNPRDFDIEIDGKDITGKIDYKIKRDSLFVSANDFFTELGYQVIQKKDTFTAVKEADKIELDINGRKLKADQYKLDMQLDIEKEDGEIYIPVRYISDVLGCGITVKEKTINIISPQNREFEKGYFDGSLPFRKGFKLPKEGEVIEWKGEGPLKGKNVKLRSIDNENRVEIIPEQDTEKIIRESLEKLPVSNFTRKMDGSNVIRAEFVEESGERPEDIEGSIGFINPQWVVILNNASAKRDNNLKFTFYVQNSGDYFGKDGYEYKIKCLTHEEYNTSQSLDSNGNLGSIKKTEDYKPFNIKYAPPVEYWFKTLNIDSIGTQEFRQSIGYKSGETLEYQISFKKGNYEHIYKVHFVAP